MKNYEASNDQTEELKKKLADHVRESNQKYQDLLQAKLDMEDELRAKFEKEKKRMTADFDVRLKEAVDRTRKEEETTKEKALQSLGADYEIKIQNITM